MDIECPEQPSTHRCSANSDENVTDQSESGARHYERREQSCNESNDQPGEEIHFFRPNDEGLGDRAKNVNRQRFGARISYPEPNDFESLRAGFPVVSRQTLFR
jgi:hypothetical protein